MISSGRAERRRYRSPSFPHAFVSCSFLAHWPGAQVHDSPQLHDEEPHWHDDFCSAFCSASAAAEEAAVEADPLGKMAGSGQRGLARRSSIGDIKRGVGGDEGLKRKRELGEG